MSFFCPILLIILQFFTEQSYKTNYTHSIFRTIKAQMTYNIKRLYRKNSLLDGTVQSGHSVVKQLCRILKNRL